MTSQYHERIEELESENRLLRIENEKLRKILGLPVEELALKQEVSCVVEKENVTEEIVCSITKYTPSDNFYAMRSHTLLR